jgi:capsular exopolysaccharide synthesis family protein
MFRNRLQSVGAGRPVTEGVPLAKLIKRRLAIDPELVMLSQSRSIAAEKFRRLKTILANLRTPNPQAIVITSAGPGEGKSLVSINLALAFAADTEGEVLLIDADLRRPAIGQWISPAPKLGLAELLGEQIDLDHALLEIENSPLRILPAGTPPDDPVELLGSERARNLMASLRKRFRRVIIDTPPSVPFTDADAVGAYCDGVLLVVRARVARAASFLQVTESLTSAPLLGVVLNDLTFSLADSDSYHGYQEGYHEYYAAERRRTKPASDTKEKKP